MMSFKTLIIYSVIAYTQVIKLEYHIILIDYCATNLLNYYIMPNIFSFNQFFTYQATNPDVLAKRDSSVEVDPYAAYYEQYTNAVHTQGLTEKQGFAGTMENVFGDDAAVIIKILAIIQFMIIFSYL